MNTTWRLILVGPADLEQSIIESALRQAGFQLAVLGHLEDYYTAISAPGVHGILVCGDRVGRDALVFDFVDDIYEPARRRQLAVITLGDTPSVDGVVAIPRPLRFPMAARQISDALQQQHRLSLDGQFSLDQGLLRSQLSRAAGIGWSGSIVIDSADFLGELKFSRGRVGAIHLGGITGAEALAVLLSQGQDGRYQFVRDDGLTGEHYTDYAPLEDEANGLQLSVSQAMARTPDGPVEVNPDRLIKRLGRLADDVIWVIRLVDGQRSLRQIWALGGSTAVTHAVSLIADGVLSVAGDEDLASRRKAWAESIEAKVASSEQADSRDDFAWKLAVSQELSGETPSLKEEGWGGFDAADDWDQLSDFEEGIEGALQEADAYFKSIAPEGEDAGYSIEQALAELGPDLPLATDSVGAAADVESAQPDLLFEPLLVGQESMTVPPVVMAIADYEEPPVIAETEMFEDGLELGEEIGEIDQDGLSGEWAPLDDELDQLLTDDTGERKGDRREWEDFRDYGDQRDRPPRRKARSRHFGAGADLGDGELVGLGEALADIESRRLTLRGRIKMAILAVVLGSVAAISTYQYSKRIRAIGSSGVAIPWDPSLKLDAGALPKDESATEAESEEEKKPPEQADAGPTKKAQEIKSLRNKRRRRRRGRRRRMRAASRAKLGDGKFSKTLQNARMLRDDGNLEAALSAFSQAIAAATSDAERSVGLSERGEAKYSLGEHSGAISDMRQAISKDPENGFALKNLGLIEYQRFKMGDASAGNRAKKLLKQFVDLTGRSDAAVQRWLADLE